MNFHFTFSAAFRRRTGMALLLIFFGISAVIAFGHHREIRGLFVPGNVPELIVAHWQLEDGFREGIEQAIRTFEKARAAAGKPVRIKQIAIPVRSYAQYLTCQLLSGTPPDVMEIRNLNSLSPDRYWLPLTDVLNSPNPWNCHSPLAGLSWQESFLDRAASAYVYSSNEFFGVPLFRFSTRVYVNMPLYRAACGSDRLPQNVSEWIESCRKMREYGRRIGSPVIPIGVRGFDKSSLQQLLDYYNSALNAAIYADRPVSNAGISISELLHLLNSGKLPKERMLIPVELVCDLGQFFAEGFPAIDLEQTKYLFFSGNVGYFIDGTYNAWTMLNNSPFEVRVMPLPEPDLRHCRGFQPAGKISESGYGFSGIFGISRQSKNRALALDFLQFLSSWKTGQEYLVPSCRWVSSLKRIRYPETMNSFASVLQADYHRVPLIFSMGSSSGRRMLFTLEKLITEKTPEPGKRFWNTFCRRKKQLTEELETAQNRNLRDLYEQEARRSAASVSQLFPAGESAREPAARQRRLNGALESMVRRASALDENISLRAELSQLQEIR